MSILSKRRLMDFAVFAALMIGAGFISPVIMGLVPSLEAYGIIGSGITYAIVLAPGYILLVKFWRRRRA